MELQSNENHCANVSEFKISSIAEVAAHIISADFISARFQPTQSVGEILANFQHHILGLSPFAPFSLYSKEKCHESVHGNGTCSKLMARSDSCISKIIIILKLNYL